MNQYIIFTTNESYKLSHYERFMCQSNRLSKVLPQRVQSPKESQSGKTRKKNRPWASPPFSSWIADQAMTELTQNKSKANEPPDQPTDARTNERTDARSTERAD